ncbi:MAG: draG 5 [Gemmataceae bacterium]|nr:draG 5 [Gemmataceae bacterium]
MATADLLRPPAQTPPCDPIPRLWTPDEFARMREMGLFTGRTTSLDRGTVMEHLPDSARPFVFTRREYYALWAAGFFRNQRVQLVGGVPDHRVRMSESPMTTLDRYRGCLLGLATGDALGTTLEFKDPGEFEPLTDMVGGGPFHLKPGEWTDDTSMALCLAESLVTRGEFDPVHQLETYVRWYRHGHMSVKGRCFDIGFATSGALNRFEQRRQQYPGSTDPGVAGNGSLMRLAPAPLAFANNPAVAVLMAGNSSRTTHGAPECVDACRYFAGLLLAAVLGLSKEQILNNDYEPAVQCFLSDPLAPKVAAIAGGSFRRKAPPEIRGSGYVIHTLEAALWAFHTTDTFRDGALKVVNLGEDADSTGAVYGQIAGAFYGEEGIPPEWRAKLAMRDLIERFAGQLCDMAFPGGRPV